MTYFWNSLVVSLCKGLLFNRNPVPLKLQMKAWHIFPECIPHQSVKAFKFHVLMVPCFYIIGWYHQQQKRFDQAFIITPITGHFTQLAQLWLNFHWAILKTKCLQVIMLVLSMRSLDWLTDGISETMCVSACMHVCAPRNCVWVHAFLCVCVRAQQVQASPHTMCWDMHKVWTSL